MHSTHTSEQIQGWNGEGLEPIAIVGMAGRFPMAKDVGEFWTRLYNEEDCISRFTPEDLHSAGVDPLAFEDPNYVAAAPVLDDIEQFDAAFFGITPREAELMDPQHRIFLECCWEALEDAGYDPKSCGKGLGLFAGARTDTYLFNILTHPDLVNAVGAFHLGLGNDLAFLSTRVSHFLNLTGPSVSLHTACSTSLVAVHLACDTLRQHRCEAALAGGVAVNVPHSVGYLYEEGSVQSPDGYCRTFDASARGTVFGSGAGVVLLKRLGDAIANQDSIYALIRGSAINNDGSDKASFTAPSVQGQVGVIREALRVSEVTSDSIGYVECHGTGTLLGDAIEVRALIKAFGKGAASSCAIGSVKTNVGHLDAAAGMTGLIKAALSLKHKTIPASLHYEKPNPQINFEGTRFYVNTATSPWVNAEGARRAGVSAFGVGGTNAHVILEEAPGILPSSDEAGLQILPLSGRSGKVLDRAGRALANHLREHSQVKLSDVAFTLQGGRHHFGFRRAVVCSNTEEAVAALEPGDPSSDQFRSSYTDIPPAVTFLFPGQGAQHVGMGKLLYDTEPVFRSSLDDCSDVLRPLINRNLVETLYGASSTAPQTEMDLNETWLAQPALLAVEYALAKLWISWGVQPESLFGHSLGEYTAATLSEVMSVEDALRLVAVRGQLMQETESGAMLAVSRSGSDIAPWLFDELSIAAFNAPDLCTVGGSPHGIKRLEAELKAQGIACQPLRTSHAFHTVLVEPAMAPFLAEVRRVRLSPPKIPFISCVTGTWIRPQEALSAEYWTRQMRAPVQFDAGLTEFLHGESRLLLDVGPGQTLRRLALRKTRSYDTCQVVAAMSPSVGLSEKRAALTALAELWEVGVPINWPTSHRRQARRVSLPTYPFERSRFWIDPSTNPGRSPIDSGQWSASQILRKEPDVSRWFWLPSWKLTTRVLADRSDCGVWIVYDYRGGLGEQVCLELAAKGEEVIRVRNGTHFRSEGDLVYTMNPLVREHHEALWDSVLALGMTIGNVVCVGEVEDLPEANEPNPESPERGSTAIVNRALFGIQAMLRGSAGRPCKYFIVSGSLMDIERNDLLDPAKAGLIALAKTLRDEYEDYVCRVIDILAPEDSLQQGEVVMQIVEEIRSVATEDVVAYRGKKRWTHDFERLEILLDPRPQNLSSREGAYLILGGLGSVGLSVAEYLAHTENATLLLTSRSALPPRARWDEIAAATPDSLLTHQIQSILSMEQAGSEIETTALDMTDREQVSTTLAYLEHRFGRVRGIIHAAGVTSGPSAFCTWPNLKPEAFHTQSRAKVRGLEVLASAIQGKDVPFVLLMSSNSSIVGGLGFAAYAAANRSMNAFAEEISRKPNRTRWLSASWDHWPEIKTGGPASDLAELYGSLTEAEIMRALELKYRYAMTKEEVQSALSYVFSFPGSGHLIVSTGNLLDRLDASGVQSSNPTISSQAGGHLPPRSQRPNLKNVFVAPRNELETTLAAIWEDFLGVDRVGIRDDFFELGGHSLLATKLVAEVRSRLGAELQLAKLFEGPTVEQMAEAVTMTSTSPAR